MQSNLCQACPSVRSPDAPALCIFNSNRQGNQILIKWAILLIQRKGIADNIYPLFVCCLADSFASVPVIWWFLKKEHSALYHAPVSKFCGLMTEVYFSLCFQLKLMTWIPVLLLLGFKNVRTLSDFLFFLLRKKGEKKLNIVGSQRCLICLWVNEILAYWEQSKDNFFSFFYSHENYNIAFFPCNQKLEFSGDFSVSWSLGFMKTVRHKIHAM